jgi:3',5'-cyclic AMP phosphodiesterase CpdA
MTAPVRIGHLSDLHLRSATELDRLEAQLAVLASKGVEHLAITGDLLDSWNPALLRRVLRTLERAGFASADRLTLIHGNHDLAGVGSPMTTGGLLAQLLRVFDVPPLTARRRGRFYQELTALDPAHQAPPFLKTLSDGTELVGIESVSSPVAAIRIDPRSVQITHAVGRVSDSTLAWLRALPRHRGGRSRGLVLHHYPLDTVPLQMLRGIVQVPMAIEARSRASLWSALQQAHVSFVLCGHVHRARRDRLNGVDVWLQGTSGGAWAGYGSSVYEIRRRLSLELREDAGRQVERRTALTL